MNLKEELLEGYNQYCDERLEQYISEQFIIYLKSEGVELTEDILQEGKITDVIRWKLAKFSLRFLKESSIDDFLMAYYSDKDGNPTEKGREWIKKKKKEKVKKLRELADRLKPEEKEQISNNKAAKKMELSGLISAGGSIAIGAVGATTANKMSNRIKKDYAETEIGIKDPIHISDTTWTTGELGITHKRDGNIESRPNPYSGIKSRKDLTTSELVYFDDDSGYIPIKGTKVKTSAGLYYEAHKALHGIMTLVPILVNFLFGVMWGSLIVGAVGTAKGLRKIHKANVLRRDEILQQLKSKRELKEEYIHHLITKAQNI